MDPAVMVRVFSQISPSLIETYRSEISPKITWCFCYSLARHFIVPPIVVWIILVLHSNLVLILTINIWQNRDQLRRFWCKLQTNNPGYLRPITRVFPHHTVTTVLKMPAGEWTTDHYTDCIFIILKSPPPIIILPPYFSNFPFY